MPHLRNLTTCHIHGMFVLYWQAETDVNRTPGEMPQWYIRTLEQPEDQSSARRIYLRQTSWLLPPALHPMKCTLNVYHASFSPSLNNHPLGPIRASTVTSSPVATILEVPTTCLRIIRVQYALDIARISGCNFVLSNVLLCYPKYATKGWIWV